MNQQELKEAALKILDENYVGVLATINENKPHSRYMTCLLYTSPSPRD